MNRFKVLISLSIAILLVFSDFFMLLTNKSVYTWDKFNQNCKFKNDFSLWSGKVLINEFMPQPDSGDNEWIELYNASDTKISLINWKLSDSTNNAKEIGGEIYPHDFLLLLPSPVLLNNEGDIISLLDNNDNIVDIAEYGNGAYVETAKFPYSIGRLPSGGEFVIFNNPTPGAPNPKEAFTILNISAFLNSNKFNPAINEKLEIIINVSCPVPIVINIFNQDGYLEKNIYNKFLKFNNISFLWDGKNEQGSYVNSGVYICSIKAFQNENKTEKELIFTVDNSKKKKSPCVITNIIIKIFNLIK